tara:strand:+ start:979 stop:1155 length:177 start_codon:yes stop_codon:yes gene_type:complete
MIHKSMNEFRNNWPEAVRQVTEAIKISKEYIVKKGKNTKEAHAMAKKLDDAWQRILQG